MYVVNTYKKVLNSSGGQWFCHKESADLEECMSKARELQEVLCNDDLNDHQPAWDLIEVMCTDAQAKIHAQWIRSWSGYHRVQGR